MKSILVILVWMAAPAAFALVTGPTQLRESETLIQLQGVQERGKLEPNANRSSYQDAMIDAQKVSVSRGFGEIGGLGDFSVKIEHGQYSSAEESVNGTLFYKADHGSYTGLELSGNFVHEPERKLGFVLRLNPSIQMDDEKFSNPRLDTYGLGVTASFEVTPRLFQRTFVYQGSGYKQQNPYVAVDAGFGYKFDDFVGRLLVVGYSLFIEADQKDRFDEKYDAAFSPAGTRDRVRAFKYGNVTTFDVELVPGFSFNAQYLEKLGGYDARATRVLSAGIGYKF